MKNDIFLFVYVLQGAIRQDQEAGYLKKPHPLQHKITCKGRTVTLQLQTHPVYLQEVTIITPSRTLFHPMHPPFHNPLLIQPRLQQRLQWQQQQLQQQQLLQQQRQLPFRISNKWVSAILMCNFLVVSLLFKAIALTTRDNQLVEMKSKGWMNPAECTIQVIHDLVLQESMDSLQDKTSIHLIKLAIRNIHHHLTSVATAFLNIHSHFPNSSNNSNLGTNRECKNLTQT